MSNILNDANGSHVFLSTLNDAIENPESTHLAILLQEIKEAFQRDKKFQVIKDVTTEVMRSIDRISEFDELYEEAWEKHRAFNERLDGRNAEESH